MRITLLRHGTTLACIDGVLRGRRDDPLNDEGWQQMRAAVSPFFPPAAHENAGWHTIISSPLNRCAAFAREFAHASGLPLQLDERLIELDFGAWEGCHLDALMKHPHDREALRLFWENPWQHSPPQGETLTAFEARIRAFWHELIDRSTQQNTLVITHGGVIRLLLCAAQKLPRRQLLQIEVPNASIHHLAALPLPELHDHDDHE